MPIENNEANNLIYKAAIYIGGVILGVMAKLAVIHQESELKFKDGIIHGIIACACAWLVWWILSYYGRLDLANIASVIVGRYSDYILRAIWKSVRNMINPEKKL